MRGLVCLLIGVLLLSACKKDDEKTETGIYLEVFGPSPALRGGEIRFIGQNLDKVQAVILSHGNEISDITVVNSGEIRITIPQDAQPGPVTLRHSGGDITTKTPLTFSEPISIEKISPIQVKAGDELTIEGEYLNLIKQVVFANSVIVEEEDFISQSRQKIVVTVPVRAQTGKISLTNGEEIPIIVYSDSELEVTQPKVSAISPNPIKPGQALTIKGTDLQLIESVVFSGDVSAEVFSINSTYTEIDVEVPVQAKEGVVRLITFSGVEIETPILNLVSPTITSLNPNPVKNTDIVTIEGKHLDLVTKVVFEGGEEVEISNHTASSFTVTVPQSAKAGQVILYTASGHEVSEVYSLVKPTVTTVSSPAVGGQSLTLTGANLDLVSSISFENNTDEVAITSKSPTSITLVIPNTVLGNNNILFTCVNGDVVHAAQLSVTPTSLAYVTSMPAEANQKSTITLSGGNFDKITSVTLGGTVVEWARANANTLFVVIPATATPGNNTLTLTTADGSTSYSLKVVGSGPIVTAIWTGTVNTGGWSDWLQLTDASLFAAVVEGDLIKVSVDPASIAGNSQGGFRNASWQTIMEGMDYFEITGDFTLSVTADVLDQLKSGGLIIGGQNYVIKQVSIVH